MKKVYTEKRKWGKFDKLTDNIQSTVKILTILPKQEFSLQYHKHREEFWEFLDNEARVTLGRRKFVAKKGTRCVVPKKTLHRIQALSKPVRVLEISLGDFDENDIVRIEDDYGRA